MDRRDRLRHLLATADDDIAAKLTAQDGQQQETPAEALADKVFYTEGTDALKEARIQVSAFIIRRALPSAGVHARVQCEMPSCSCAMPYMCHGYHWQRSETKYSLATAA